MQTLSATEIKQAFGAALDLAQREPVFIRSHNRDVAVLMSMEQYKNLRGERSMAFDLVWNRISEKARIRGLTDEKLEELTADIS